MYFKQILRSFSLLFLLGLSHFSIANAQGADREKDHEELRSLLKQVTEAVNSGNYESLSSHFASKFTFVSLDQKKFTNVNDLKKHFEDLTKGEKAPLKSFRFIPTADNLTEFPSENVGLSTGTSSDTYVFADGDTRTMQSAWSAFVIKEGNQWKILSAHVSANILDNPVTTAAKNMLLKVGIACIVGGLLLGMALGKMLGKRNLALSAR